MRKIISLFLTVCMILSGFCFSAVAAEENTAVVTPGYSVDISAIAKEEYEKLDSTTALPAYGEDVTLDKTSYKITTPDELMYMVEWTNKGKKTFEGITIYLAPESGTLDMSGKEFAPMNVNNGYEFKGTLDGLGTTINNLTVTNKATSGAVLVGLFARVKGATVKNLILGDSCSVCYQGASNNVNKGIGAIAAVADGITVENVCSYATVSFEENTAFENPDAVCVAGLVGWIRNETCSFDRTTNVGNVSFTQTTTDMNHYQVGGFVGGCPNTANAAGLTITNSVNKGNIDADGKAVGGFVGETPKATCTFSNLRNEGDVTAEKTEIGGIIGCVPASGNVTVENCVNTGEITSEEMGTVGGILGLIGGTATITGCTNFGLVNALTVLTTQLQPLGGIVAKIDGENSGATISNCKNYGRIGSATTSNFYASGILGLVRTVGTSLSGCENYGIIYGISGASADDVAGWSPNADPPVTPTVENCTNYAPLSRWVGYQVSTMEDGDTAQSIRFVGSIDSSKYREVGFYVTVKDESGDTVVKETSTFACTKVYTEMYAMGADGNVKASECRPGGYLFGAAIYDIPVDDGNTTYTFEVETYAITLEGYTVIGEAYGFSHQIGTTPASNS